MLHCEIVGLTQDMDFGENVSQTFVVLSLPNGKRVRAAINEATAQAVVELQVAARGVPRQVTRMPGDAPPAPAGAGSDGDDEYASASLDDFQTVETPDGVAHVFGGQDDSAAEDTSDYAAPPEQATTPNDDFGDLPVMADPDPPPPSRAKDKSPKRTARNAAAQQVEEKKASGKPRPKNLFRTPEGKLVAPARTIPRNEAGFPIVPSNGGVDADSLTTSRNQDEDGVGSI